MILTLMPEVSNYYYYSLNLSIKPPWGIINWPLYRGGCCREASIRVNALDWCMLGQNILAVVERWPLVEGSTALYCVVPENIHTPESFLF